MHKHLFMHRLCKVIRYQHFYESKYGIKGHNKRPFVLSKDYDCVSVSPADVCLGFDALKDEYTLLNKKISESPHHDLMSRLYNGHSIEDCDYVIREESGYLDGRYEIPMPDHYRHFIHAKNEIQCGMYKPPLIYVVEDKYYAFDGKHRLALCALLDIECKCMCMDVCELTNDSTTRRLLTEMKKRSGYDKNIQFLQKIL